MQAADGGEQPNATVHPLIEGCFVGCFTLRIVPAKLSDRSEAALHPTEETPSAILG